MADRMRDFQNSLRPQGPLRPAPTPPSFLPEINDVMNQKMKEMFDSLTPEQQAALKNVIFGQRLAKSLPASYQRLPRIESMGDFCFQLCKVPMTSPTTTTAFPVRPRLP
jgi:hypothetical protein